MTTNHDAVQQMLEQKKQRAAEERAEELFKLYFPQDSHAHSMQILSRGLKKLLVEHVEMQQQIVVLRSRLRSQSRHEDD